MLLTFVCDLGVSGYDLEFCGCPFVELVIVSPDVRLCAEFRVLSLKLKLHLCCGLSV